MDALGKNLLARSRFSLNEDGRRALGVFPGRFNELPGRRRAMDHIAETVPGHMSLVVQILADLLLQLLEMGNFLDEGHPAAIHAVGVHGIERTGVLNGPILTDFTGPAPGVAHCGGQSDTVEKLVAGFPIRGPL